MLLVVSIGCRGVHGDATLLVRPGPAPRGSLAGRPLDGAPGESLRAHGQWRRRV